MDLEVYSSDKWNNRNESSKKYPSNASRVWGSVSDVVSVTLVTNVNDVGNSIILEIK